MSDDSGKPTKTVIQEITEHLATVFHHLLPGVLIIGVARVTHPSWFKDARFYVASWPYLAVVGVMAIAVGNAWFAVNRYVIYQLVDCCCWRRKLRGLAKCDQDGYLDYLAKYVREALVNDVPRLARQHVEFRRSAVLLIYTLCELSLVAAVWSERGSMIVRILLGVAALALFCGGVWQHNITGRIDDAVLHQGLGR